MKTLVLILVLLVACTTDDVVESCGPQPPAPAFNVAYQTVDGFPRAVLTVEVYQRITAWRNAVDAWGACMEQR